MNNSVNTSNKFVLAKLAVRGVQIVSCWNEVAGSNATKFLPTNATDESAITIKLIVN